MDNVSLEKEKSHKDTECTVLPTVKVWSSAAAASHMCPPNVKLTIIMLIKGTRHKQKTKYLLSSDLILFIMICICLKFGQI